MKQGISGQIPDVSYRVPCERRAGIEVLDLSSFYQKLTQCCFDPGKPHRLSYYCFVYITAGSGRHFVDFESCAIGPGSLVRINKNQTHAFDLSTRPQGFMINITEEYMVRIGGHLGKALFNLSSASQGYPSALYLDKCMQQTCGNLLNEILRSQQRPQFDPLPSVLLFASLLASVSELWLRDDSDAGVQRQNRFNQFQHLVEANVGQFRDTERYAALMHMSYKSLNLLCRTCCGQTAKQVVDGFWVLEIKRRLVADKRSIQAISDELGFDDVSYFAKYFKRQTQLTPAQYRARFCL